MQIFKHFLLAGSIAVALSPVGLRADDTEAQALARAALQQKMREMNGQAPAAVTPPESAPPAAKMQTTTPPEPQVPPTQKQAPRPVVVPAPRRSSPGQPPVAPPAYVPAPMDSAKAPAAPQMSSSATLVAPPSSSPDLIEQARQATRAKLAELQGQQNNATPPAVSQPAPVTATKATPPVATAVKPAQPSKAEIQAAKERDAAAKKAAQQKADMEKAAAKQAQATAKAKPEAPAPFTPLAGPASSLPATKEQRLQALLDQYKADKVTAEEYHDQRAKIIAEP